MTTENLPVLAILGGTGDLGTGLARRWAQAGYEVIIGSRTLEKAQAAARSLLGIINDILDFSKLESGTLDFENVAFDMPAALHQAVELMAPRASAKSLVLNCDLDSAMPAYVVADPGRLRQVLLLHGRQCVHAAAQDVKGVAVFADARLVLKPTLKALEHRKYLWNGQSTPSLQPNTKYYVQCTPRSPRPRCLFND